MQMNIKNNRIYIIPVSYSQNCKLNGYENCIIKFRVILDLIDQNTFGFRTIIINHIQNL